MNVGLPPHRNVDCFDEFLPIRVVWRRDGRGGEEEGRLADPTTTATQRGGDDDGR
jgi:hypothetical protein